MTLSLLLFLGAAPCLVSGADVSTRSPVLLAVDGGAPVKLSLRGVSVRARLEGSTAHLVGDGPLAFTATTRRLRLQVATPVVLFDGGVVLQPGAAVQWREARGDAIAGTVIVAPDDDELETEDKAPLLHFTTKGLPCAAFTLDEVRRDVPFEPGGDGPFWTATTPLKLFATSRNRDALITLSAPQPTPLFWRVRERRGGAAFVEFVDPSPVASVALHGWVPLKALTPVPPGQGIGSGAMCTGDHDVPMAFGHASAGGRLGFQGPLTLAPGTVLFVGCPTQRDEARRCAAASVTAPLQVTARWWGGETAEVVVPQLLMEDDDFLIDARTVSWPDAGER